MTVWGDGLDFVDGDYGADVVVGGAGDQLFGGTLNDNLSVRLIPGEDEGAAYMNGGYDDDRMTGSELPDVLQGNIGEDRIFGHGGDDTLRGGGSNDYLQGDGGADKLFGEFNADEMRGSEGDDTLTGGRRARRLLGRRRIRHVQLRAQLGAAELMRERVRRKDGSRRQRRQARAGSRARRSSSPPTATPSPTSTRVIAGYGTVRESDGKGGMKLLDKDRSQQEKPNVVALGTVHGAREFDGIITSRPKHQKVEWAYTNTCSRDYSSPDVWRSTGNRSTSPVKFNITMPPKRGQKCDVAIWGKIADPGSKKSLNARLLYR